MSKVVRLFLLGTAFLGIAGAQVKIGIVNSQKALLATADIKKAQQDLETKYRPRQEEIQQLQKDLQTLQQKAQTQGNTLSAAAAQDLNEQIQTKQRELQRKGQDLQDDVNQDRNDILQRAGARMQDVVHKLAEQKGLDVVIDSTNTLFYKAALDLTNDAVAAYDQANPVK